jgi:hypothetical protein
MAEKTGAWRPFFLARRILDYRDGQKSHTSTDGRLLPLVCPCTILAFRCNQPLS